MKDKIIEIDMNIAGLKQILASSDYKALKHPKSSKVFYINKRKLWK